MALERKLLILRCTAVQKASVYYGERANNHGFDHIGLGAARISDLRVYLLKGRHQLHRFHNTVFRPF